MTGTDLAFGAARPGWRARVFAGKTAFSLCDMPYGICCLPMRCLVLPYGICYPPMRCLVQTCRMALLSAYISAMAYPSLTSPMAVPEHSSYPILTSGMGVPEHGTGLQRAGLPTLQRQRSMTQPPKDQPPVSHTEEP